MCTCTKYTIYGLRDPRDSLFHYVGISANPKRRYYRHSCGCDGTTGSWVKVLRAAEIKPELVVLARVRSQRMESRRVENGWIRKLLAEGHPLVNSTENLPVVDAKAKARLDTWLETYSPRLAIAPHVPAPGCDEWLDAYVRSVRAQRLASAPSKFSRAVSHRKYTKSKDEVQDK